MELDIGTQFFLMFVGTIALTRALLFFRPISSPIIGGVRLHHYMYGLAGLTLALPIDSLVLYSISLGLFTDELAFVLMGGQLHREDYSTRTSLVGTLCFIALAFLLKDFLASPFLG